MQPAKSYDLKWNNCEQIFTYNFKQFLHEAKYTDCILAAEGKFIKAHRLVLAAASAYFDKMFEIGKQEPMIVLSDVLYEDLLGIIEFVYTGHVSIPSDNYQRFMRSARCLQLKGVSDQDDDPDESIEAPPLTPDAVHSESSRFSVEPPIFDMNEGTSNEGTSLLVKEESLSNTPIITEEPRMGRSRGRKRIANELGESSAFPSSSSQFLKILLSAEGDSRLKSVNGEAPIVEEPSPVIRREKKKSIHWRKRATNNMDPLNTSHFSCVCRFCENRYSRHSIPSHERNCKMNPNRRVHQCTICLKVLSRADKLNDHMKIHLRKSM